MNVTQSNTLNDTLNNRCFQWNSLNVCNGTDCRLKYLYINYKEFSFVFNGCLTLFLAAFGLFGNIAMLVRIYRPNGMSWRLRGHLTALAIWDTVLVLSCAVSYGMLSFLHGATPFFGSAAYLLFIFQPLGTFAACATVWQMAAITIERYLAVRYPLQERVWKSKVSVTTICVFIAILVALLNFPLIPIERQLAPCFYYETKEKGQIYWTVMNLPTDEKSHHDFTYTLLCKFVPDLIFRFPIPVTLIIVLTVRTLQLSYIQSNCSLLNIARSANNKTLLILTLLNLKFLICHSLYMINTAIDMLHPFLPVDGESQTKWSTMEGFQDFFTRLYMTDAANLLVVLHSATNWILFIKQHSESSRRWTGASLHKGSTFGGGNQPLIETQHQKEAIIGSVDAGHLQLALSRQTAEHFARPLISALGQVGGKMVQGCQGSEEFDQLSIPTRNCTGIYQFMVELMGDFADKRCGLGQIRAKCRQLGAVHCLRGVEMRLDQQKAVRALLSSQLSQLLIPTSSTTSSSSFSFSNGSDIKDKSKQSETKDVDTSRGGVSKLVAFLLAEMKQGALCHMVEFRRNTSVCGTSNYNSNKRNKSVSVAACGRYSSFDVLLPAADHHQGQKKKPFSLSMIDCEQTIRQSRKLGIAQQKPPPVAPMRTISVTWQKKKNSFY